MRNLYPVTSANVDLVAAQNATFSDAYQFDDPTVTTWSFLNMAFRLDIKTSFEDPLPVASLTTGNGMIVVDDVNLRVLHFNAAESVFAAMPPGCYVYDMIMTDQNGVRTPLMHGTFTVGYGVTGG
jgi:hypothetical protein